MFISFFSTQFLGRQRRRLRSGPKRAKHRYNRLQLEALEDRTVLNAGTLDPTFGSGGIAIVTPSYLTNWIVAVQSTGKIVEGGTASNSSGFELVQLNPDGAPDSTFGAAGAISVSTTNGALSENMPVSSTIGVGNVSLSAIAFQDDGKILVAGSYVDVYDTYRPYPIIPGVPSPDYIVVHQTTEFFLARFNSDGTVDQSFGKGGLVLTAIGSDSTVNTMAIQSDGQIVLGGVSDGKIALARYNTDGTLDSSFGNGGTVVTSVGAENLGVPFNSSMLLSVQADGSLLVAEANNSSSQSPSDLGVLHYQSDGSLDTTFGNGGITTFSTSTATLDGISAVALQPNGDILVAGQTLQGEPGSYNYKTFLTCYTTGGQLDTTFGNGGLVLSGFASEYPSYDLELLVQPADGKILLGATIQLPGQPIEFALARYESDGAIDPTFGAGGQVLTTLGLNNIGVSDLVLQPDGQIIVAGQAWSSAASPFLSFVARLTNDTLPVVGPLVPPLALSQLSKTPLNLVGPPVASGGTLISGALNGLNDIAPLSVSSDPSTNNLPVTPPLPSTTDNTAAPVAPTLVLSQSQALPVAIPNATLVQIVPVSLAPVPVIAHAPLVPPTVNSVTIWQAGGSSTNENETPLSSANLPDFVPEVPTSSVQPDGLLLSPDAASEPDRISDMIFQIPPILNELAIVAEADRGPNSLPPPLDTLALVADLPQQAEHDAHSPSPLERSGLIATSLLIAGGLTLLEPKERRRHSRSLYPCTLHLYFP